MTKLLTHMNLGVMPANTFLSPRLFTGPMPSGTCFATTGDGGDAFVGGENVENAPAASNSSSGPTSITARAPSETMEVSAKKIEKLIWQMVTFDKEEAKQELIEIGEPAIPILIKALHFTNNRYDVGGVLVAIGRPAIEPLTELLNVKTKPKRLLAVELIGKIGGEEAAEPLMPLIRDKDSDIQINAIRALGEIGDAHAIHPLFDALRKPDKGESIPYHAQEALIKIGGMKVVDELIKSLDQWVPSWRHEPDPVHMLGKIGDPRAIPPLAEILRTGHTKTARRALQGNFDAARRKAAKALGEIGHPDAIEPLLAALESGNSEILSYVIGALGKCGDSTVVERLVGFIDNTSHDISSSAIKALKRIDPGRLTDEAFARLGDENRDTRRSAIDTLAKIGGDRVVDLAIAALGNENIDRRRCAAYVLARMADDRAVPQLTNTLSDPDEGVRRAALYALYKIKGDNAVTAITSHEHADDVYDLIEKNAWAYRSIGSYNDGIIMNFIQYDPEKAGERALRFGQILQGKSVELEDMPEVVRDAMAEQAIKEALGEQAKEITVTIKDKVSTAMDLNMDRSELADDIKTLVEDAKTSDEAREFLRTLNFLVHRGIAMALHDAGKIPDRRVVTKAYSYLDGKQIKLQANRIMLDRLAFEMASKIYVHGNGDVLFDEDMRQAIAINSYLNLGTIVYRDHLKDTQEISAEQIVRMITVSRELSRSDAISKKTKKRLSELADNLLQSIPRINEDDYRGEIDRLTATYRRIYRNTDIGGVPPSPTSR